jgi:glycosyltransferase involved in cell wall biosynthesis
MRLLAIAQSCDVIVASQEGRATLVAFLAARILSKPIIGHIHFDWSEFRRHVRRRQFAALQRLYPRMTHVVACGEDAGRSLLTLTRVTPQRLTVIPNFIDPTDLHARAAEPIPEALRPILHQPILAGMGRFTLQKGFDILIRAHARLLRQGLRHHLLLLGEGDLRKEYVGLAQSLGVEDTLFMPGFMKNPFPLLRASSVFALPSRFEGLPYALIEAMTLGLPIVSCDCPSGPREMLDHGQYGLLVPVDDDQALSQAILRIMSDDSVRSRLADLSTQRSAWYHADRCLRLWENLLRGVT